MLKPYLFIATTEKMGRGVFTSKDIPADTIIEISPVIVMSGQERQLLDQTLLYNYIFEWGENQHQCCMALGLIPVYNHSYQSNCEYHMDFEAQLMMIKTVFDIKKGEELTINYNGEWDDSTKVWFETADV